MRGGPCGAAGLDLRNGVLPASAATQSRRRHFAAYLRSPEARGWLEAHSRGSTTLPAISLDTLVKLPVILPDLATQQEIADVMMRLENHEQALRRQLELAEEIRRDVLNGLLTSRS